MAKVALVTGATAGIGAAFTRRLAAEGYDLVLVARDAARLESHASELSARHGVGAEVLPADLMTDDGCATVTARLADSDRPIDLLANNAGMGIGGDFLQKPVEDSVGLTQLNVLAVLRLSHAALRPMLARRRGDIINVSSVAGFTPGIRDAAYAASKAWVTTFSETLHVRTAGTGVRVMALCPGFTHSEFHLRAGVDKGGVPGWMWSDADDVVAAGLRALHAGRAVCVPGMHYRVLTALARHAPRGLVRRASARTGERANL